jgi:MFS transporter, FHS family, glucose/mannose:H+ symporter
MRTGRAWLSGFLLLGVLLSLLGSLVVAWQYYIDVAPQVIGLHFLFVNAGYVIAAVVAERLLIRVSIKSIALTACILSSCSLLALGLVRPPVAVAWRLAVLGVMGLGAGALGTSLLYASQSSFEERPATAVNQAGILFGCGCLLSTVVVGGIYFFGSVQLQTLLLAIVPLLFMLIFSLSKCIPQPKLRNPEQELLRNTLGDLRSIATVLFSLLLFFQFGNEWAIAGWLPLFLIHRLGSNPVLAIGVLAIYFVTLMLGRLAAQKSLPFLSHRRLLLGSIAAAMFGFLLLIMAGSLTVAAVGVVIIGAGYAPIYPLIAERLDDRFSFHPGFYNGAISIAITGAMSAPWLLGFVDAFLGMRSVMLLPAFGSIVVLLLSLLLTLEAHVMADKPKAQARSKAVGGGL